MNHIIIILRGHERNCFKNDRLKNFVHLLNNSFENIEFIVHTWNLNEASKSWRQVQNEPSIIHKTDVQDYFDIQNINILIDDEISIEFKGRQFSKIGSIPIICWKRMWYGQYVAINAVEEKPNTHVLNMRMDFFETSTTNKFKFDENFIINKLNLSLSKPNHITFMHDSAEYDGIDNLYISSYANVKRLIYHFNNNLDSITNKYKFLFFHENMVFYEARLLEGVNLLPSSPIQYYCDIASNQLSL
jgi:hypothetical protein